MTWFLIVSYLSFGFMFGIFREWSYQWVHFGPEAEYEHSDFRWWCAFFCFPFIHTGFFYVVDGERTDAGMLRPSGGGFLYWTLIAILWPIPVVWSVIWSNIFVLSIFLFHVICVVVQGVKFILSLPRTVWPQGPQH